MWEKVKVPLIIQIAIWTELLEEKQIILFAIF